MIYKIEPCPWCGNKVPGIGYEPPEDGWDERWYISCKDCNTTTFRCETLGKAIENWNTLTRVMHIDWGKGYIPVHERRKVTLHDN